MHILMTVNAAWNIWNFRRPVFQALLRRGYRVTVLAPPDASVPDLEAAGCRFIPLEMNAKGLNPVDGFSLVRQMERVFRSEAPDIILSYTIKNNIFGAFAAKAAGIPFVPNVTGLGTAFLSGGLLQQVAEILYRRAFRGLETVFFQNQDDSELFQRRRLVLPGQVRLLPGSGINLDHFAPAAYPGPDKQPVFLLIARLLRDKGVVEFVDAARQVRADYPDARFQLLGAIGAENRTAIAQEEVRAWVEEGVIQYLGTVSDVRPIIRQAHCIVLPSYREGAPRTLIEAAAMGRPVITTDVPGCRAVVDRDISGFLCEVRNPYSLATAMTRFLALSREEQTAMAGAGRAKMEREFSEKIVVQRYLEVIEAARLTAGQPGARKTVSA